MTTYSRGIRGAITLKRDTKEEIKSATVELLTKMLEKNEINKKDIAFVIFTQTSDIHSDFPAKYARLELGFDEVPMMCYHEANVEGSLKMCLRVLINVNTTKTQSEIKHIYLKGASVLRQDLQQKA